MATNTVEPEEEAPAVRICRECAAEIPLAARKCKSCGSFQDSRRFMTVSQSSVTFILALVALLAHFTDQFRSTFFAVRDYLSGTNFALGAGLVSLTNEELTVILSSRRSRAIGVSGAGCFVYLPVDPEQLAHAWLQRRGAAQEVDFETDFQNLAWIGPFMLSYELPNPEFFRSFDQRMITFQHTYTGFPGTDFTRDAEAPLSFCSVFGGDEHNSLAATAFLVSASEFSRLDALQLLKEQTELDLSSGENERRLRLIGEVEEIRNRDEHTRR